MNHNSNMIPAGNPVWGRIVSMLVLGFAFTVAQSLLVALVIGQVLFRVLGKTQNEPLKRVGRQVSDYIYHVLLFLTFNSEYRPFPYHGLGEESNVHVIVQEPKSTQQR